MLQVVCWQLVAVAALLAIGRPWPLACAIFVVGAVVVALTAVRLRGRWLYEWLYLASKYSLRERDRDLRSDEEAGRALLRLIAPDAVGITDDDAVFMLSRAAGITAVLQPKSATPVPAPEALLPPPHEQAPAVAAQVIHHAGVDRERVWVALQVLRTAEVHRDAEVRQALGNTVRRVQRQFRRDGLPVRALAGNEVLGVVASLAHVTAGRSRVREDWRLWHSGPVAQATFRIDGWSPELVRLLLAAVPQAAVTVAVTAYREAGATEPRVEATVRVAAAHPGAVEHAARELARLAAGWRIVLERLDGRHRWGMAATLPLGRYKDS